MQKELARSELSRCWRNILRLLIIEHLSGNEHQSRQARQNYLCPPPSLSYNHSPSFGRRPLSLFLSLPLFLSASSITRTCLRVRAVERLFTLNLHAFHLGGEHGPPSISFDRSIPLSLSLNYIFASFRFARLLKVHGQVTFLIFHSIKTNCCGPKPWTTALK